MSSPQERGRPREPGKIRSVLLALAVHGAFFALIVFGVSWQSRPIPPLQAELWDKLPPGKPAAEPKAEPPPEPTQAAPAPEPKPEPKAEPKPPPVPTKAEPPRPDPAIAEKKERERKERERKELERKEQERKAVEQKKELEKKAQEKKAQERKEREAKAAADAKAAAEARSQAAAKAAAEAKARAEAEAQARAAEAAAQARQTEIDRYRGRIRDKIRGKANVPDSVTGRPEVQVRITILPGGEVLDIVIVKTSGNRVYDAAIERAIRSAQPLPVPSDPELFGQFRSLTLNIQHER